MDQQCHFDFGPGYSLCTAVSRSLSTLALSKQTLSFGPAIAYLSILLYFTQFCADVTQRSVCRLEAKLTSVQDVS